MKCPRCGCINPNVATHCKRCQVDLVWAREHPEELKFVSTEELQSIRQQKAELRRQERERLLKERGPVVIQRTCSICRKVAACDVWEKVLPFPWSGRKTIRELKCSICPACQREYKQLRNKLILFLSAVLTLWFATTIPMQEHIEQFRAGFLSWVGSFLTIFGISAVITAFVWGIWVGPVWLYHKATRR